MSDRTLHRFEDLALLRAQTAAWRAEHETVILVPTMGALHAGHRALIEHAGRIGHRTIVSIFVNPTQFGPNEDFSRYPRDVESDLAMLVSAGTDVLWLPSLDTMYPSRFATQISVRGPSEGLCDVYRPGHFSGVATIVAKLLNQVQPDIALFGEKDFQQLRVIQRMAEDLDLPSEIRGVPTVREPDGLAFSSRNRYLNERQRAVAPQLHAILRQTAHRLAGGGETDPTLRNGFSALTAAGFGPVQYLELRDALSLEPVATVQRPARLLAAAFLGDTRLIDNVAVEPVV